MTPTAVRRKTKPKFDPIQTFTEFVGLKTDGEKLVKRANSLKDRLKDWMVNADPASIYVNENGSRFFDLPETVVVGGTEYKGFEARRSVKTTFNEEKAEEILRTKGGDKLLARAQSSYVDQDKVALLVQTGDLEPEELDAMFAEDDPTYSFYPTKGEVL